MLIFSLFLFAAAIKVPTEFYSGWADNRAEPGSAPLISDLTFRTLADHIIDQGTDWFDPEEVQQGDIIYLNLWYINWFHAKVHDQIKNPYILLSCDVGNWLPDPANQKLLYDPKLAAWFCRNICFTKHPKLFQIPMGQTDRYFGYSWLPVLQELSEQKPFEKKYFLYLNYQPRALGDRDKIVELFEHQPYCLSRNRSSEPYSSIPKVDYYREMAASTFVLSPLGLETDCVRHWEALTLDAIPVIEHSFLDPLFEDLPVHLVYDWNELNEEALKTSYAELKDKSREKAAFPFWQEKIKRKQAEIKNGQLDSCLLEATKFSAEELEHLTKILEEEGQEHPYLICKGFLTATHSLQIAHEIPFIDRIYLNDPWLSAESLAQFPLYMDDLALLEAREKVTLITETQFMQSFINYNPFFWEPAPIFIDLSYQRSTLLPEWLDPARQAPQYRHNLENNLLELYEKMGPGGLLLGNQGNDPYVQQVLTRLEQRRGITIEKRGPLWFFKRPTK